MAEHPLASGVPINRQVKQLTMFAPLVFHEMIDRESLAARRQAARIRLASDPRRLRFRDSVVLKRAFAIHRTLGLCSR
jgi:hypothetical protein